MDIREFFEAIIIISCGLILLSPIFNTVFYISYLGFIENISNKFIGEMASGLIPIILVYFVDMFRYNATD